MYKNYVALKTTNSNCLLVKADCVKLDVEFSKSNQKKCSLNTEIDQSDKHVDRRVSLGRSRLILH